MRSTTAIFCGVLTLFSLEHAEAVTIHVPGDSSTIQGAINGTAHGDTVLVAAGTYPEHVNFNGKAILVTSEAGAESTTISRFTHGLALVTFNSGEDTTSIIEGFTLRDATPVGDDDGTLLCHTSSPTIRNNVFTENAGTRVVRFIDSRAHFTDNFIRDNPSAMGISSTGICGVRIWNNLICGNSLGIHSKGEEDIIHNTISGNEVGINPYSTAVIKSNIIVNGNEGIRDQSDGLALISYNDVWNNVINYHWGSPGPNDISEDPLFCDADSNNYSLSAISPCIGAGEGGSDIGAFGADCGWMVVHPGPDQSAPANAEVPIFFGLENIHDFAHTVDLDVSDQLGWTIDPTHYQITLDPGQWDTVDFTVSIPAEGPPGVTDTVCLDAVSQYDSRVNGSGCLAVVCESYSINITEISDVGNDQGKQVHIDWSSFPGSDPLVTDFSIFRRRDSLLVSGSHGAAAEVGAPLIYPPGEWEWLATVPAFGETLYSAVVPTLKDSTVAQGMYWSVFFIRAGTDDPVVYFDSPVDSGYSLDNLSPSPPAGLLASHEPAVTKLTWSATPEVDFDYYTIYRDTLSGFTPTPGNRLGYTIDSIFVDSTAELGRTYYYVICATDFSGNESAPSNEATGVRYMAGDANADGVIGLGDVVYLLNYLFKNNDPPKPLEAGDATCDGAVDMGDAIYLLNYLFKGADPPAC